jgi:hypothetical protein
MASAPACSKKEAVANASDALAAIIEAYEDLGRSLPAALQQVAADAPISVEDSLVFAAERERGWICENMR